MMARRLFLFLFAAALITAFGCSSGGDVSTTSPAFACGGGGATAANAVTLVCGASTSGTQQVDVVIVGSATLSGLSFNVMYDGDNLVYHSFDASAASQLFPGALISVAPSTEPNSAPGFKDLVVGIQGSDLVPVGVGQHVVLSLTFTRAPGTTFTDSPLAFNIERTLTATPETAGTDFVSGLTLSYQ